MWPESAAQNQTDRKVESVCGAELVDVIGQVAISELHTATFHWPWLDDTFAVSAERVSSLTNRSQIRWPLFSEIARTQPRLATKTVVSLAITWRAGSFSGQSVRPADHRARPDSR